MRTVHPVSRLLRLIKLVRMLRTSRLFERYRAWLGISFSTLNLLQYVGAVIITGHWFACLWGFIGCSDGDNEDSWVYRSGESRPVVLYTISLYYSIMTLTTVGYGDVTPGTLSEYVTATFIMFVGGFIWAYVIGGLCSIVQSSDLALQEFQQNYDRINAMMVDYKLPYALQVQVRTFLYHCVETHRRSYYPELLQHLSQGQQREISVLRSNVNIMKISYFKDFSKLCLLDLYQGLDRMVYAPQEHLDKPFTLYLVSNDGVVVKHGQIFGRGSVIAKDFILDSVELMDPTCGTALTFVEVEYLERHTLDEIMEKNPDDQKKLRKAQIKLATCRAVMKLTGSDFMQNRPTGGPVIHAPTVDASQKKRVLGSVVAATESAEFGIKLKNLIGSGRNTVAIHGEDSAASISSRSSGADSVRDDFHSENSLESVMEEKKNEGGGAHSWKALLKKKSRLARWGRGNQSKKNSREKTPSNGGIQGANTLGSLSSLSTIETSRELSRELAVSGIDANFLPAEEAVAAGGQPREAFTAAGAGNEGSPGYRGESETPRKILSRGPGSLKLRNSANSSPVNGSGVSSTSVTHLGATHHLEVRVDDCYKHMVALSSKVDEALKAIQRQGAMLERILAAQAPGTP